MKVSELNIYQKLQKVRVAVQNKGLSKSGKNAYQGFEYFELKDFLNVANEEFDKLGLCPVFNILETQHFLETGECVTSQKAVLKITDGTNEIIFETPSVSKAMQNGSAIQDLGAKHTYLKRYLYMNALEIAENDMVDAQNQGEKEEKQKKQETKATKQQIEEIKQLYPQERIEKMLIAYKVKSLSELTVKQASEAIKRVHDEQKENK